ncbi:MAG TPA: heme-binding protein [Chloroflexota bacterium]|nr:heme-binding protein [Chloroflexota bacterium]
MAELSGLTRRELLGGASLGGLAVAATLAGPAASVQAQGAGSGLSLAAAQTMINAAIAKAREIGVPMTVVVVDDGGNLKAAARMDGSGFGGIEIVLRKAVTAAGFRSSTQALGDRAQSDPARLASFANLPHIWLGGGGLPVMRGGELLGGSGAGGGTPEQDTEVAQAGVAAFS